MNESALYEPVKRYFETIGYSVYGEVRGCDLAAMLHDQLVVAELKITFCLRLLYQGIQRQNITPHVYICIARPKRAKGSAYNNMLTITKRLGLGLITVALDSPTEAVDVLMHPLGDGKPKNQKKDRIIREATGRSGDYNIGGSRGRVNTAYREKSIRVACVLEKRGPLSPRELVKEYGCSQDAGNILYKNYYRWFERVSKGLYCLSEEGRKALDDPGFAQLVDHYRKKEASP